MDYRNTSDPDCIKRAQLTEEISILKSKIDLFKKSNKLYHKIYDWPGDYKYTSCPMCHGTTVIKVPRGYFTEEVQKPAAISNRKICFGSWLKGCSEITSPHFHRKCKACGYKFITKTADSEDNDE